MSTLGFDMYVEPLKLYLQKFREAMKGEKGIGGISVTEGLGEELTDDSFGSSASLWSSCHDGLIYCSSPPLGPRQFLTLRIVKFSTNSKNSWTNKKSSNQVYTTTGSYSCKDNIQVTQTHLYTFRLGGRTLHV
ncbi:unnamed protein product [Oncorhynchus mykiss]|uniref:Transcription factor CBF/NF-Y/archaeal histone domain-containing protein n=1 Tax=Oncorhynchus mykiss TaxID=8022 RepID=A0A060ZQS8_ONCMY|nr:unnamed protein product [Oncorhynchus mykiss]